MLINFDKILKNLGKTLTQKNLKLSLCESCTGGLLAKICTDYEGSSLWFLGGIVTYSNSFKEVIGVNKDLLKEDGAVSQMVAKEMSLSTLKLVNSDICLSITGIAGPTGGSLEKPIGTVCFSFDEKHGFSYQTQCFFEGSRSDIRYQAANKGAQIILDCASQIKTQ
tara:strand:+ start:159 stop:656 length:498 start_codon:yes stop_codon:yes gene_type:complete